MAALADEGKWVRRFNGWGRVLGLTDAQLKEAVVQAREEAEAAAGAGVGGGVGSGTRKGKRKGRKLDGACS